MCYTVELMNECVMLYCGIENECVILWIENECVILWNWEWMCYTVELIMNVLYCGIDNECVMLWNW